jgi:hypothetical protein
MDKKQVDRFIRQVSLDIKAIKFEDDGEYIKMSIGNFFLKRKITDDYDYDVKKLFEDFIRNTTAYYTNVFWEI